VRSAFAPVALPLAALIASLIRWSLQGSGNLYTALDKRFFVPDPDLGWRVSTQHPIWLGLEVCGAIAGVAAALAVGGWLIRRRERTRGGRATALRAAAWATGALTLAVPIAAFVSGAGPLDGRDTIPTHGTASIDLGIAGALELPAGRYEVVKHEGSSITARISAGGETFDARFTDVTGAWQGDPRDLAVPMTAELAAATASVDTGIELRTQHARDDYLLARKFPRITWKLDRLVAARPDGAGQIAFRAKGTVGLAGKTHAVDLTGTLRKPDAAALARLGIGGEILVAQAELALVIKETVLAPDAGDFDGDRIPVHVSLVLRRTSG
jgi:polyisoprenoid-binding protein YceI